MTEAQIQLPEKLAPVFSGPARYRGAYGGRGSGKSYNFAKMLAVRGYVEPLRILCGREIQNSIKESSMAEVIRAIEDEPWLAAAYDWGESYIRNKLNGTEFMFKGLHRNLKSVKSMSAIDILWIEEAESMTDESWRVIPATVREPGSEIWLTWNPEAEDSPTNKRMVLGQPQRSKIVKLNYMDNPWFTEELELERQDDLARDPDMYRHIWLGETITRTEAQVFNKRWSIKNFSDDLWKKADRLYFGADFGFAQDPSTLIRFFTIDNKLYVEYEAWGVGVELDHMPQFYGQVPGAWEWPIKADNARPETISYLRRKGFNISAAEKWKGSVEDGVTHIKGFDEIIIHERCERTANEFNKYSYKVDKQTGDILPVIVDKWNHCIDAIRYGLDGLIHARGALGVWARLAG